MDSLRNPKEMRKLTILFLSVFFYKCNSQPEIIQVKLQAEELQVIKDTFPSAVCCYWQQMEHGFRSDSNESRADENKRFKKIADSIYQNQLGKVIWLVKDTLFNPANIFPNISYPHNSRVKLDTSYSILEKNLHTDGYPNQAVKLDGLIIGNYLFSSVDSVKKRNNTPRRYIFLSRVVFNLKHTKACYYISQSLPENHWAGGEMMFIEKKHGKWFLLYRKLYWIT